MKRLITLCLLGSCFYLLPHRIMYPKPGGRPRQWDLQKSSPVCGLLRSGRLPCRRRLLFDLIQFQLSARFTNITLQRPCQLDYHRCGCTLRTAPVTDVRPEHGNRVWAPSIRHHNGEFYIFWGDPDQGAFMVKAKDPKGPSSEPVL